MKKKILIAFGALVALVGAVVSVWFFGSYLPEKKKRDDWSKWIEAYYENKLNKYEQENALYEDFEVDVAFLGDSITDGYDLGFYYPEYTVLNRGIGGDTTHGLLDRIEISLYNLKPKVAVMLIGVNNIDTMLQDYEALIEGMKLNTPKTKIVLCSLTPMGADHSYRNKTAAYNNVIIKKLAEKHGCEFVDTYSPLFDIQTCEIYADYTSDGLHLSPKGYSVMTEAIKPVLEKLLSD